MGDFRAPLGEATPGRQRPERGELRGRQFDLVFGADQPFSALDGEPGAFPLFAQPHLGPAGLDGQIALGNRRARAGVESRRQLFEKEFPFGFLVHWSGSFTMQGCKGRPRQ